MAGKQKNEKFLRNFGGLEINDLTKMLNYDSEIDESTATIIKMSNYHDIAFCTFFFSRCLSDSIRRCVPW